MNNPTNQLVKEYLILRGLKVSDETINGIKMLFGVEPDNRPARTGRMYCEGDIPDNTPIIERTPEIDRRLSKDAGVSRKDVYAIFKRRLPVECIDGDTDMVMDLIAEAAPEVEE